jgi:hypothetical protein
MAAVETAPQHPDEAELRENWTQLADAHDGLEVTMRSVFEALHYEGEQTRTTWLERPPAHVATVHSSASSRTSRSNHPASHTDQPPPPSNAMR